MSQLFDAYWQPNAIGRTSTRNPTVGGEDVLCCCHKQLQWLMLDKPMCYTPHAQPCSSCRTVVFFPWLYGQKNLDTSSSVSWNSSTNASVCGADRGFLSTSCMGCRAWLTTWLGTHSSCLRITCPVSNMFCLRLKAPPCKFGESMAHYSTSRKNAFGYDKCLKQKHPHHPRFKPALYPQLTEIEWSNTSFSCMNHLPSGYLT
jgi:hypothetical protein